MSDWDRDWPAPAKINLFLHVVGRRADGYHQLQTVFRFLDYGDTLRCEPRSDDRIVLAAPLPGVPPETDLVVRAAQALRAATGHRRRGHPASRKAPAHGRWPRRRWGVAKLVKAPDFDSGMRRFESFLPSQTFTDIGRTATV
jgi:hypothetical protein